MPALVKRSDTLARTFDIGRNMGDPGTGTKGLER